MCVIKSVCVFVYVCMCNDVFVYMCYLAGLEESVIIKMHKGMLTWFGHVEHMEDERLTKNITMRKRMKEEAADDPD